MKLSNLLLLSVAGLSTFVAAEEAATTAPASTLPPDFKVLSPEIEIKAKEQGSKFQFEAEVNRMMKLIINSLYKTKEIFLRELISNASDALDKIRFLSLTKPEALGTTPDLKISIVVDQANKALILTDTGVGMTKEDLMKNLGTIAKSGTSEFLSAMQNKTADMGLIGQFGVGFYSVFLVADSVTVISKHNDDKQYIWESNSESDYSIMEDPRGNTLGRGTQVIVHIKDEAAEYLKEDRVKQLVKKYSEFINFPIYLWSSKQVSEEVPVEEEPKKEETEKKEDTSDDVEDAVEEDKPKDEKPKTKTVTKTVYDWERLNDNKPIWVRNPKEVTDEEYNDFYKVFAKTEEEPLLKLHFRAEGEVEFKALFYIPKTLPPSFLERNQVTNPVKLFVRRVFITDELPDFIPRYFSFIKGIIDSDDMPLNVSRETLQQHSILKVIKKKVLGKILEMFRKMAENEPEKYKEFIAQFNSPLKFGIIEDQSNQRKLSKLVRFHSSIDKNLTSLDEYVKRMKPKQPQIYYITGTSLEEVEKSPFVEKIISRGYEVLYMINPIDEYVVTHLPSFKDKKFQSAAKLGLKFGDEDSADSENETYLVNKFTPLSNLIKKVIGSGISEVVISNRLTTSPCAIVATPWGVSGMMEKILTAQRYENDNKDYYFTQPKIFEINPHHPIIEALNDKAENADESIEKTVKVLYDAAALRSGYNLKDPIEFAKNIEKIVRTNLGVDLEAQAEVDVKPAPEEEKPAEGEEKKEGESAADAESKQTTPDEDEEESKHDEL